MQQGDAGQAVEKVLDVLAARFGTTMEHLWAVLVRQARIEAVGQGIGFALCALAFAVGVFILRHPDTFKTDDAYRTPMHVKPERIVVGIALVVLGGIIGGMFGFSTLSYLLNPEFHALKFVLATIGG